MTRHGSLYSAFFGPEIVNEWRLEFGAREVPFPDGLGLPPAIQLSTPLDGASVFRLLGFGGLLLPSGLSIRMTGGGPRGGPPPGPPGQPCGGGGGGPPPSPPCLGGPCGGGPLMCEGGGGGALWPCELCPWPLRCCPLLGLPSMNGGEPIPGGGPLGSGIGHICIVIDQSGWIIVSHIGLRIISPFGPTKS
jgi:hypothetical protein